MWAVLRAQQTTKLRAFGNVSRIRQSRQVLPKIVAAGDCFTSRQFASDKKSKKPKSRSNAPATSGRVVRYEKFSAKKKGSSRLCVGCGAEVLNDGSAATEMAGGTKAASRSEESSVSNNRKKQKSRYTDIWDQNRSSFLCNRCKQLQKGDIFAAYDSLRDVSSKVFEDQLQYIVNRRRFGLALMVVDVTDAEHTVVKNLRRIIRKTPVILIFNKVDLMPRFSHSDRTKLERKIQKSHGITLAGSYAVSAATGQGMLALAIGLLERLRGRDVFCLGAANVGKSTLVQRLARICSKHLYLKGSAGAANKRRSAIENMSVTTSHLPGTTLQAVRIPCFPSKGHALWDTPGIINSRAVQYSLFPSHLMEPLTRPEAIPLPTKENGRVINDFRPGQSILIEADWMKTFEEETDGSNAPKPCILARLDLLDSSQHRKVYVQAFLHPSLKVYTVPTEDAPDEATIPETYIAEIQQTLKQSHRNKQAGDDQTHGLKDSYSLPLAKYTSPNNPEGSFTTSNDVLRQNGKYAMDITFASLGWLGLTDGNEFSVAPWCVKGSIFSKRMSLYPVQMAKVVEDQVTHGDGRDDDHSILYDGVDGYDGDNMNDDKQILREMRQAYTIGRQTESSKDKRSWGRRKDHDEGEFHGFDDYHGFEEYHGYDTQSFY